MVTVFVSYIHVQYNVRMYVHVPLKFPIACKGTSSRYRTCPLSPAMTCKYMYTFCTTIIPKQFAVYIKKLMFECIVLNGLQMYMYDFCTRTCT